MNRYFVSTYTDGPATRWNVIDRKTQEAWRFGTKSDAQAYADKLNAFESSTAAPTGCDQCPGPMEGPHHPECYRFVDGSAVSAADLIPLFRDAASVNMTEEAVERQARRFAEAIISLYDVRHK